MTVSSVLTSRRNFQAQALVALALIVRCPYIQAEDLKAGAARVEITPPIGHQLWGLASRVGPSTGVLDPLYARVLVLKSANTSLAVVALDLGRTF
ncbi:MAG TPA: hypothetical protein VHP35_10510, partial [Terriglobia bacterium]|nr:hypothetical protein [Terriglobia bacterium]